jgi:hypothetical protein
MAIPCIGLEIAPNVLLPLSIIRVNSDGIQYLPLAFVSLPAGIFDKDSRPHVAGLTTSYPSRWLVR